MPHDSPDSQHRQLTHTLLHPTEYQPGLPGHLLWKSQPGGQLTVHSWCLAPCRWAAANLLFSAHTCIASSPCRWLSEVCTTKGSLVSVQHRLCPSRYDDICLNRQNISFLVDFSFPMRTSDTDTLLFLTCAPPTHTHISPTLQVNTWSALDEASGPHFPFHLLVVQSSSTDSSGRVQVHRTPRILVCSKLLFSAWFLNLHPLFICGWGI